MNAMDRTAPEFSGLKGRFFAWFLTSPLRAIVNWKTGKPDARFTELLDLHGDEVALDAGSGSGYHSLMVARRLPAGRVIAVDVSQEMLDRLRSNADHEGLSGRIEPLLADTMALPLEDASVDVSYCVAVWHHLEDPVQACAEMARVLRPRGQFLAVDLEVHAHAKPVPLKGHDRQFGMDGMRRLLERTGLEEVHVERVGRWVIGSARKAP